MPGSVEGYMTTKEAGEYLKVTDSRIRQYIQAGRLVPEKAYHINLIPNEQVEKLALELRAEAIQKGKRGPKAQVSK